MAEDTCDEIKQKKISIQEKLGIPFTYFYPKRKLHKIKSNNFCEKQISKLFYYWSTSLLEKDITRIYSKSLACDLKFIYKSKIINTNQCIVEVRSPQLFNFLKPYFFYNDKIVHCYIKDFIIYHQIENFIRLLYTNSNIALYEQYLMQHVLDASFSFVKNNSELSESESIRNKIPNCNTNDCSLENVASKNINEEIGVSSDMADSGLDTESIASPRETISEHSSTDLDETNDSAISRNHDDKSNISGKLYMTEKNFCDQNTMSGEDKKLKNENSKYGNHIGDPFYESNDESSDENEYNSYIPLKSIPFSQHKSDSLNNDHDIQSTNDSFNLERFALNGKQSNVTIKKQSDTNNSAASSSYFFIDASSLNDDIDVATVAITTASTTVTTTNITEQSKYNFHNDLSLSNPQLSNECFISSSISNNFSFSGTSVPDDLNFRYQSHRLLDSRKMFSNLKDKNNPGKFNIRDPNDEVDIFGENHRPILSFAAYPDSSNEPRKMKSCDALAAFQQDQDVRKSVNKESLVVEIKEADSGESAQHSPCPDNTKLENVKKIQEEEAAYVDTNQLVSTNNDEEEDKKPPLIRRNTFELDANDEKLSNLRQEYEKRQGKLVFQNSITQYSRHRIDGDPYFDVATPPDSMIVASSLPLELDTQISLSDKLEVSLDKYNHDCTEKSSKATDLTNVISETAMNSIARSTSDKLLLNRLNDEDLSFSSLPVDINDELNVNQVKSKLRRNEAAPIISGGSSSAYFQKNATDSPGVRRRIESTPIVSGGSVILAEEPRAKEKNTQDKAKDASSHSTTTTTTTTTAWVVDMSDCRSSSSSNVVEKSITATKKVKPLPSVMSLSLSSRSSLEKDKDRDKAQPSSLGYFVNLESLRSPKERTKETTGGYKHRRRPSDTTSEKSYCEFFVDLSDKQQQLQQQKSEATLSENNKPDSATTTAAAAPSSAGVESDAKKNIFSMFIDLNEPESSAYKGSNGFGKSSSSSKIAEKKKQQEERQPSVEKKPKSSVFMFIESDSPLVRRRTLSSSRPAFKRHSWNTDKSNEIVTQPNQKPQQQQQQPQQQQTQQQQQQQQQTSTQAPVKIHKRAHSLSIDRFVGNGTSSHPLFESTRKFQRDHEEQESERERELRLDREYDARDTPPNSHVEIVDHEELLLSLKNRESQELKDAADAEAKAASKLLGQSAVQDECCSEGTETRKSETFDISSSASGPSSASDQQANFKDYKFSELLDATQQKLAKTKIKTTSGVQSNGSHFENNVKVTKTISSKTISSANFVRLSDLDKRPSSNSSSSSLPTTANHENSYRLSENITCATSWIESKSAMSMRTNEPLYRTLTKKLPLNLMTVPVKSENVDEFGTEGDVEAVISESDLSSLQSSMGRSGHGSTEETETSTSFAMGKPYNRLGEDLLRMFLEEINPDVTIDVGGRQIRAHKCILSSRCQYFAAILSGGWIENSGNVISLQGYSYNAVHFALRHIYSGESCIPDTISIVELATLADMLCLEGLKEVIGFTLKVKYCHLFHKPCSGCAVGVLECMPLAAAYGLDEVYRKSLRWVTRYFVRIWPSKEFATLPRELMDKCYLQHIVHMSIDNVLQTIMDCDKLLTTLPNVRWAEPVFRLVSNLVDASMKYLTDNFASILGSESFQGLDQEQTWNISRLEDHLLAAAERLPPEQACRTYSKLDKMFNLMHADDGQHTKFKWSPLFVDLLNKMKGHVEKCLVRDAARAARTNSWLKMDLELRRRIQELACLVILPNEISNKRPSRHSNFLKEPKERVDTRISFSRTQQNRNLDLRKMKMAFSEHNDRTLKQTPLLQTRKIMNKPKTDPLERKLQNEKLSNDTSVSRPKSWPNKIEVKSRYLEPRNRPPAKENTLQSNPDKALNQQRRKIMISSSDSSRTSSPAMRRAAEKKNQSKIVKVPVKKDGKALSSDSLTETNCRPNTKKEIASKSCGITRPESPSLKVKNVEAGLSVDSLADTKRKQIARKTNKMDTSMSTDSLMTDATAITTPKSMSTNKSSPILGKAGGANSTINQTRNYDKLKKFSPPTQQRNATLLNRRPARSLENSTAASRSRAAAVANTYHGSLNLRKSLLDAAKAPDIPSKTVGSPAMTRSSLRQSTLSMRPSFAASNKSDKSERKDELPPTNNQRSNSSPGSKRSPKSNVNSRLNRSIIGSGKQQKTNKLDDKTSSDKNKAQATSGRDQNGPKFLNQSSRSGTFLKDEPTILNKSDIETAAIDV